MRTSGFASTHEHTWTPSVLTPVVTLALVLACVACVPAAEPARTPLDPAAILPVGSCVLVEPLEDPTLPAPNLEGVRCEDVHSHVVSAITEEGGCPSGTDVEIPAPKLAPSGRSVVWCLERT
jgi:hypothetical protein